MPINWVLDLRTLIHFSITSTNIDKDCQGIYIFISSMDTDNQK